MKTLILVSVQTHIAQRCDVGAKMKQVRILAGFNAAKQRDVGAKMKQVRILAGFNAARQRDAGAKMGTESL